MLFVRLSPAEHLEVCTEFSSEKKEKKKEKKKKKKTAGPGTTTSYQQSSRSTNILQIHSRVQDPRPKHIYSVDLIIMIHT